MKKIKLLTPALLTPTLLASTSLSSCSYADYQVTEEEIKQIISLEGVKLMQTKKSQYDASQLATESTSEYSDDIFHTTIIDYSGILENPYYEAYVKKVVGQQTTYTKWDRTSKDSDFGFEEPTTSSDWYSIADVGEDLLDIYESLQDIPFLFDTNKKCYMWSAYDHGHINTVEFYFFRKKLIAYKYYMDNTFVGGQTFEYNQITPVPPTC